MRRQYGDPKIRQFGLDKTIAGLTGQHAYIEYILKSKYSPRSVQKLLLMHDVR